MSESLIQQYFVCDQKNRNTICKALSVKTNWTVFTEEAPANFVPAAAVIRKEQVLFKLTGRKGRVDGLSCVLVNHKA